MLADPESKDAVLVDPVIELAERDAKLVSEMGLNLKYVSKYPNDLSGCRVWVYGIATRGLSVKLLHSSLRGI